MSTTTSLLRPIFRLQQQKVLNLRTTVKSTATRSFTSTTSKLSTQSGDDAKRPSALARIYLEDGTTLLGRSFGSHKSVDGEVRTVIELYCCTVDPCHGLWICIDLVLRCAFVKFSFSVLSFSSLSSILH